MPKKTLFFILISIFSGIGHAQEVNLIGKLVRTETKIKGINSQYFLFFQQNGVDYAYPVKGAPAKLSPFKNQFVELNAKGKKLPSNAELSKEIIQLEFISIKPLSLTRLAGSGQVPKIKKQKNRKNIEQSHPRLAMELVNREGQQNAQIVIKNVPDKAVNTVIGIAGAALLGSMIADRL